MAMTPGLSSAIRLGQDKPAEDEDDIPVNIEEGEDVAQPDEIGKILQIEHSDGSITISLDGKSLDGSDDPKPEDYGHFDNLVDAIDENELGRIASELIRGVEDDLTSRKDWIEQRADGIKLLGLKLEVPTAGDSGDGAAVEGMSRIRHPLLLEACLRFQANARGELLPTDGPVKIRDDNNNSNNSDDQLADALEKDMNHFLTATATEYYPDTDRMLLMLGFGGTTFKKVYYCPLRNRPVSESIDAPDLIVNNAATDLGNAKRITHRTMMRPSTVKRLQLLGVYRDVDLSTPLEANLDAAQREKADQQGVAPGAMNPEDRDREIYECYCELDVKGFEHKWKNKVSGLQVPYRVTIDLSSQKILAIVRNYEKVSKTELPIARDTFVDYTFVPGFGFYAIGLLHILGNATNAVTAAWRELLDMGMFANFPGFLFAKSGQRQQTNIFRVPPGGGAAIDTQGMDIAKAIMPLPYSAQGMPALMSLVQDIVKQGQSVGSTSELQVGEGRADAPVGTTLAIIDVAQKIINSVHKRLHSSQAREFQLLKREFKEHPDSFWQCNNKPAFPWDEQTLMKALDDCNLVPQADPNTASTTQRLMKMTALKQLQAAQPGLYDPLKIETACLQALGFSNPEQFFAPPEAQAKPPPEMQKMQAELQIKGKLADATVLKAQTDAQKAKDAQGLATAKQQMDQVDSDTDNKVKIVKTQMDTALKSREIDQQADDGIMKERMNLVDVAQNIAVHPEAGPMVEPLIRPLFDDVARRTHEMEQRKNGPGLGAAAPALPGDGNG